MRIGRIALQCVLLRKDNTYSTCFKAEFSTYGHNNFSTKQDRWEWTSPLFFWDQARVKWHITWPPSNFIFQSWIQDGGLQDGGCGTHVTHFVQLYTASQVRNTSRSWDKRVLTDLCLTLYWQS
jgi:hypothetical protein